MNYMTTYYKNKSESLQEQLNFLQHKLQKLTEDVSTDSISGRIDNTGYSESGSEQSGLQQELARLFANWGNTQNPGQVLGQILARYSGSSNMAPRRSDGQPIGPNNVPPPENPVELPKMKDKNAKEESALEKMKREMEERKKKERT